MLVTFIPRKNRPTITLDLGGVEVEFRLRVQDDGTVVMAAEITDERALQQARKMRYTVRPVAAVAVLEPAPTAPRAPEDEPEGYPAVVAQAMRNGWAYVDLTGTGRDNQWGEEGGRSTVSGLTMAEASLCTPPEGWEEKRKDFYPWEILPWRPPGMGWTPPKVPSKRAPLDKAPEINEAPVVVPEPQNEGPEAEVDPDPAAEAAPVAEAPPVAERRQTKPPETRTEEALAGLSKAEIDAAVTVIVTAWLEAAKAPSPTRARFLLEKAGQPKFSKSQVQAMLDLAHVQIAASA